MKLKEFKSNMNKTQKYFVIVGVMSFLYWFIEPLHSGQSVLRRLEDFFLDFEFFPFTNDSHWFYTDVRIFSFVLIIGSGIGYYLFKDD